MLLFNAGRLGGYFLFGGFVGLLGKALNPGGQVTGYLTIILSLVMIGLALRILKLMPAAYCRIPMPGKVQKRLMKLSKSNHPVVAVILGALTFFVPCGFTQSVQLLALGSGGFLSGAVMMFVFALGTLPALLSISLLSSVVRGKTARVFFLFSGALVLLLGLNNLQSGLLLTGVDAKGFVEKSLFSSSRDSVGNDPYVTIDEKGQQIIAMYVTPQGYKPDHFTVKKGLTTWIYAIADVPPSGCANFMQIPTYGVGNTIIKQGGNWVGPIVTSQDFVVTCSMGMYRATVTVQE
jgi:sulfite exporter TauE/SafE